MPKKAFFNLSGKQQDAFFDQALETFAHTPYEQTSLSALLKRAGMAKGTFYQYFFDKLDLYDYLVENVAAMKQFYIKSRIIRPMDDFFRLFELLLRLETAFSLQHPSFHSLLRYALDPRQTPFSPERINDFRDQHRQDLHTLLIRSQLKGKVITEADAAMVSFCCQLLLDEFHAYVRQRIEKEKKAPDEAFQHEYVDWINDSARRMMFLFHRGLSVQKTR